jgi:16S rRNA (adenine1518-N6/adenine1519-N6)-dimethyltransferase
VAQYPPIQIVDENDTPIRGGTLDEVHKNGILHRVVHVFVEDENGNILLQKRGPHVATHPNLWDYSAAGHVDEGENYMQAATRELAEELGISGTPLTEIEKFRRDNTFGWRIVKRFAVAYRAVVPVGTQPVIEKSEVTDVRWFSRPELAESLRRQPGMFTPGLTEDLGKYYEDFRNQAAG